MPHVRRVAAEALGRIGDARAVPALLAAAARPLDRVGEHAVTYALIEIGDAAATRPGLTAAALGTRRAALVALDQMRGDALTSTTVVPLLDARESELRETAWWIAERHPDWGEALAGYFAAPPGEPAGRRRGAGTPRASPGPVRRHAGHSDAAGASRDGRRRAGPGARAERDGAGAPEDAAARLGGAARGSPDGGRGSDAATGACGAARLAAGAGRCAGDRRGAAGRRSRRQPARRPPPRGPGRGERRTAARRRRRLRRAAEGAGAGRAGRAAA